MSKGLSGAHKGLFPLVHKELFPLFEFMLSPLTGSRREPSEINHAPERALTALQRAEGFPSGTAPDALAGLRPAQGSGRRIHPCLPENTAQTYLQQAYHDGCNTCQNAGDFEQMRLQ